MPTGNRWIKWIVEYRFVFIVCFLVLQNIAYVTYSTLDLAGVDLFGSAMGILVFAFCILAVSKDKKSLRIGIIWGILAIISAWVLILSNFLYWLFMPIYLSFYVYTTVVIIYNVAKSKEINLNIIFGSIAGFLLISSLGSAICTVIETFYPGSFNMTGGIENPINTFFYFTIITMTSLGYGDITPATDITRSVAVYLVLIGQLYLVILVAILVGKFITRSIDTDDEIAKLKREIQLLKKG